MEAKVMWCGSYLTILDVKTNRDLTTLKIGNGHRLIMRCLKWAEANGYTLTNVRNGMIYL